MILWILAYLGGLLTILSPCILPVLPFVFSTAERPFRKSGLPLLAGMAAMFAVVATLAVVGGGWVIHANQWGRWLALAILSLFALSLLSPGLAEKITRPLTQLGGRLHQQHGSESSVGGSFLLGIATGLLWAPCAGPILGLILTGAALRGANASTSVFLLAYALGAATSLGAALLAGGRLLRALRNYLGADVWVRRVLGILVLGGVLAIARGWDRGVLTQLSRVRTESLEERLIHLMHPDMPKINTAGQPVGQATGTLVVEGTLPDLSGAVAWINSPPLTPAALRGKVVLIDFWTYSCINCLRSLPYVKAWADKYKNAGLVVIGVHTPEFAFEKEVANVQKAVHELGVSYPVAIDSRYAIWNAFGNEYWPAHYFIDAAGKIRGHHFGEGDYEDSERTIQKLLAEIHSNGLSGPTIRIHATGAEAPSQGEIVQSPETYIGYSRSAHQVAHPPVKSDQAETYASPGGLALNEWSLVGRWKVRETDAVLLKAPGKIVFRFHARDLHLVLGPQTKGARIHFIVRLDGKAPGQNHGTDTDTEGRGIVQEERLYQLIRMQNTDAVADQLFEIEFLDPGVEGFAFTFG